MAISRMSNVIEHLRRATLRQDEAGLSDGQLLEEFISRRDEAALAALVKRHGPMVWGVCRRVLRNYHDAEDAFQAAFLVLVRKAASIVPREMVVNWLYGVARQTALKARATAARRGAKETQVMEMPEREAVPQSLWEDLQPLLDQELSRLPDKYRVVILLCDLEGKTRKEAAQQLSLPEGTVAGWLARARTLLAKRLARRGVALSGSALAALLTPNAASACVPASLVSSTIKAATLVAAGQAAARGISIKAVALMEGVLKTMLLTKCKIATAVLLMVAAAGLGAGGLIYHLGAAEPADKGKEARPTAQDQSKPKGEEAVKSEAEKLQGTWIGIGGEFRGQKGSEEESRKARHKLVISEDKFTWGTALNENGNEEGLLKGTIKIDPTKRPKSMDMSFVRDGKSVTAKCIYELDGDTLKLCYGEPDRPTEFKTRPDSDMPRLYVWKREKK